MSEHPKERGLEADDPMEMAAARVPGDPALMLDCLVEEFSRMSLSADQIAALFEDPEFLATHGLSGLFGRSEVRRRVGAVLARCGILRVRTSVLPPENPFPCTGS